MGDPMMTLFISLVIPMFLMMLVLQGEAKIRMMFIFFGLFSCFFCANINGAILELVNMSQYDMTYMVTPIVEEIIKAVPILVYAFFFNPNRRSILECSILLGIGFGMLENAFIMLQLQTASVGLALIRGFGAGLVHGLSTLLVGYGISFVHLRRKLFFVGTYGLLLTAIIYHACYNLLIQSAWDFFGILITVIPYIAILLVSNRTKIHNHIAEIRVRQLEKGEKVDE